MVVAQLALTQSREQVVLAAVVMLSKLAQDYQEQLIQAAVVVADHTTPQNFLAVLAVQAL